MTFLKTTIATTWPGALLELINTTIIGWAGATDTDEPVWVEILGDGSVLQLVKADRDLGTQFTTLNQTQQRCGFAIMLNEQTLLSIGKLEARLVNTNAYLAGSLFPHRLASFQKPALLGQVEHHAGLKLWGWLWNPQAPDSTQRIVISSEGLDLVELEANLYRRELAEQGVGHGRYGFEWTLPIHFADGKPHQIHVFDSNGQALPGSPLDVFVANQGYRLWAQQLELPDVDLVLLDKIFTRYESYMPLSLGLSLYSEWQQKFGLQCLAQQTETVVNIVIYGEGLLDATLHSLYQQTHRHWQVLICDRFAELIYHDDERVISVSGKNWTETLKTLLQTDTLICCVRAEDTLASNALSVATALFDNPDIQLTFSDTDVIDESGARMPWFKPDWDLDLFLHTSALDDLFITRSGNCRHASDTQLQTVETWPALALSAMSHPEQEICHLPWVLTHRADNHPWQTSYDRIEPWLSQQGVVDLEPPKAFVQSLNWPLPERLPKISILIPTRDQLTLLRNCLQSLQLTDYPDLEIIVINNDSREDETLAYLKKISCEGIRVIDYQGIFNFSAMNNAAAKLATGELLCLLNNDIEVLHADWLKIMVSELYRQGVGAVGAKLLWPNGQVQHGGVLLGQHGLAGHIGNDWHDDDSGYFGMNQRVRTVSAVTAACLLCYRSDYLSLGGLNTKDLAVNFNDVDFCLRLRSLGKRCLWTPQAKLLHLESASRGHEQDPAKQAQLHRELNYMRKTWGELIASDPYYNPNLNLDRYSHAGLAFPPREPSFTEFVKSKVL